MNLWHDLKPGPEVPDIVNAVIEIPKGSRNKYELDKESGAIKLDRVLYSALHYPCDYGIIPRTFYDDGDPFDIMVMVTEPTFPGCVIAARPIALWKMLDRGAKDYKVLAVPAKDPLFGHYKDIGDVPPHFLREVFHFFEVYKDLEGQHVEPLGWENAASAKREIKRAIKLYTELRNKSPKRKRRA